MKEASRVCILPVLILVAGLVQGDQVGAEGSAQALVGGLAAKIAAHEVDSIEILQIPPRVLTSNGHNARDA